MMTNNLRGRMVCVCASMSACAGEWCECGYGSRGVVSCKDSLRIRHYIVFVFTIVLSNRVAFENGRTDKNQNGWFIH